MASILHMEPEQVYVCAAQLRAHSEEIRLHIQAILASVRSVDWYSPAREIFQAELEQVATAMTRLAADGDILAGRLQREADQWQQTDDYFAQQFSQVIIPNYPKG